MTSRRSLEGLSLIEMLVVVAIVAILASAGIPSFNEWIQNTQIRTAAESIASGLQTARAEAIRRSTPIEFTLTGNGGVGETGWQIVERNTGAILQSAPASEGSRNATLTTTPGDARTVTFSSLGRVADSNSDATPVLNQIDIDNTNLDSSISRDLRIGITVGGSIRMCDPAVYTTGDPRKC
jgi:type IV fimbrial biogenesis protein FimT